MFDGGLSFSVLHVALCSSLLLYKHRYMFVASFVLILDLINLQLQ